MEASKDGQTLYLPYRESGKPERLAIDAKTLLPVNSRLITDLGDVMCYPVPGYRKPGELVAEARRVLRAESPLVVERQIWYGNQKRQDVILAYSDGRAYTQTPTQDAAAWQFVKPLEGTQDFRWTGGRAPVRLSSLGLRGLEPFWGGKTAHTNWESRVSSDFTAWGAYYRGWAIRAPGRPGQIITVLYGEENGLPAGYCVQEPGQPDKRVSYNFPVRGRKVVFPANRAACFCL